MNTRESTIKPDSERMAANERHTETLSPKITFAEPQAVSSEEILRPQQTFNQDAAFVQTDVVETEAVLDQQVTQALQPRRSLWRRLLGVGLLGFGVAAVGQTINSVINAWQGGDWVLLTAAGAGGLVLAAGIGSLASEWRRLLTLRRREREREVATDLLHSQGIGQARPFCEKLAHQSLLDAQHPVLQRWRAELQDTHNDQEVSRLYASMVQPVLDKQARAEISRYAAESAVMVACSPLALVDMAFIAWRNLRLVNRIANLYGIELGYFSRVRLLKMVLFNIAFAGVTDVVRDVGVDLLSQDITARLSARAAQGIGVGLLTARLGIKAMELCRPLPWINDDKPRLGMIRQELLTQVKQLLSKPQNPAQ